MAGCPKRSLAMVAQARHPLRCSGACIARSRRCLLRRGRSRTLRPVHRTGRAELSTRLKATISCPKLSRSSPPHPSFHSFTASAAITPSTHMPTHIAAPIAEPPSSNQHHGKRQQTSYPERDAVAECPPAHAVALASSMSRCRRWLTISSTMPRLVAPE